MIDEVASYVALIKTLELELLRERERSRQERENEQEEKRQLEDDLKAMTSNYEGSQNQYALMQDLYSRASDTTMRLNRENEQLREENETIKEQLTVGLKQKELFYQAIIDAKDQELTEATTQRDVLMQQAAKTGDAIREKAGQSQFLKVELQDALTRIAACDRCSKVTQSDEESDYNPTQEDSFVPGEPRVMRTRRNDAAVTEQAPEAQEKPRDGNARLHASPDPLSPIRKQYPLNSFERWTRAPNKLFPAVKPLVEKTFDMDIKSVNMVYMCRWRPAHGNLCSALFATREHLAEHAVDHLNDKEE
ncbi:hypothetical protein QFC19_008198 [Naganishia cerealis]|uniref:Uncharacterized protein n=1 Tax=Naganishia cerealis TaxID=610337 RepID=A0ACC2V339_9TREE|nr:hypothetical protein QFC19_008198 [Naganishia cerealis]